MTDRVAEMERARDEPSVHFMTFTRFAKDAAKTVCFFEGEDQKYFGVRIDLILKSSWVGIDCGGKKNVLKLYTLLSQHNDYKKSSMAFFVDRDFDDPISQEMRDLVYETPCYSIENLYCTEYCLSRVLASEFKLGNNPEKPELMNIALEHFKRFLGEFELTIRPLNIWLKAHRAIENKIGIRSLNLHNVGLDKFVKINKDGIRTNYIPEKIHEMFPDCYTLSDVELDLADKSLANTDQHLSFRGKYQIEFVRKYLSVLKSECEDKTSRLYNRGNTVKLSLSKGNFISELSQYAQTPDCLIRFLERRVQLQASAVT